MKFIRTVPKIWRNLLFQYNHPINSYKLRYSTSNDYLQNLQIKGIPLQKYIKHIEKEYETMKNCGNIDNNRIFELQPVINVLNERKSIIQNISNLKELLNETDTEIKKLALEEKELFENQIKQLDQNLIEAILPIEREDSCNSIVLEVNMGVGGQESMLFAKELFEMYCNFAAYKGWEVEIADYLTTDIGGIRHGSALINGPSVFRYFKYEAGVHRVQRIPTTEKAGRIHTSTVSVVALPQPDDIEIRIDNRDLRIETKRASGAGGQHVNTTDSAVRIVHLPTNTTVECQVDRSQIKNREIALKKLRAQLYQRQLDQQIAKNEAMRRTQVRSNFRNEKIRTYNFPQDRITDHRLNNSNVHNLESFLDGNHALETLIEKLDNQHKFELLLNIVDNLENK